MFAALDPVHGDEVTVEVYVARHGRRPSDPDGDDPFDDVPDALCPACGGSVFVVAEALDRRSAHFRHRLIRPVCPTVPLNREQFLRLVDLEPNPAIAHRLRSSFYANWRGHFGELKRKVPFMTTREFCSLLSEFERRRHWRLRDLREHALPYLLLSYFDYQPQRWVRRDGNQGRRLWFRFCYPGIARADGLWIDGPPGLRLMRLSFSDPASPRRSPNQEDLRGFKALDVDFEFLDRPPPEVDDVQRSVVEDWIAKHVR